MFNQRKTLKERNKYMIGKFRRQIFAEFYDREFNSVFFAEVKRENKIAMYTFIHAIIVIFIARGFE
jgi:hypothetical protein